MIEETVPTPNNANITYDVYAHKDYQLKAARSEFNPTVRENLQARIDKLEQELAEAKASMVTLSPLLDIKIRDIRRAMDY